MSIRRAAEVGQFLLKLNGDYGRITYEFKNGIYNLMDTTIPKEYRGRGYGEMLAKKTFDYIAENNWRMILSCDFLVNYYMEHQNKYRKYVIGY